MSRRYLNCGLGMKSKDIVKRKSWQEQDWQYWVMPLFGSSFWTRLIIQWKLEVLFELKSVKRLGLLPFFSCSVIESPTRRGKRLNNSLFPNYLFSIFFYLQSVSKYSERLSLIVFGALSNDHPNRSHIPHELHWGPPRICTRIHLCVKTQMVWKKVVATSYSINVCKSVGRGKDKQSHDLTTKRLNKQHLNRACCSPNST